MAAMRRVLNLAVSCCPVEPPQIREEVAARINTDGYRLKDEAHITVVTSERGRRLSDAQFTDIAVFLGGLATPEYQYSRRLFAIDKPKLTEDGQWHERQAIVCPVSSDMISEDLRSAFAATDVFLPLPFLHITLATRPDTPTARRGIGVSSIGIWAQLKTQNYAENWQTALARPCAQPLRGV